MFKLRNDSGFGLFYATSLSSGFDVTSNEETSIQPGRWKVIKTGLYIVETLGQCLVQTAGISHEAVPEIQIRPRSGLAAKFGITVLNCPSTIDADYRGEIMVTLINHGTTVFEIKKGDRIAQAICALSLKIPNIETKQVTRGTGGFGSTGVS